MRRVVSTPKPEEKQCTSAKFSNDLGRLVINVEVWYNLFPFMGEDIGALIKDNMDHLWPGLDRDSFSWGIYYKEEDLEVEDDELEDDNDYRVRVMLQFKYKPGKTSTPINDEESRLCAIQSLCKTLLDTATTKRFAEVSDRWRNPRDQLNWKPSTRAPLTWDNQRFGEAFCLQVLPSIGWKTLFPKSNSDGVIREPETKYFGPCQSMLLLDDFKILFEPQISHLQEIFGGETINSVTGMTQNAEDTVLYILKSCVSGPKKNQPASEEMITAFPAREHKGSAQLASLDDASLELEVKDLVELYKTKTKEATGGFSGLFQPIGKSIDQAAVLNTIKKLNTARQLTNSLHEGSKELESRHSKQLWKMGINAMRDVGFAVGSAPVALAAAETVLAEAGFSTAATILAEIGLVGSSTGVTVASGAAAVGSLGIIALAVLVPAALAMVKVWKEKKKFENFSKAIFESGNHSHSLWLFLIVFHMRESGVIANDDPAFIQWANQMANVFSVSVKQDWSDPSFVEEHLQVHVKLIENALESIKMDDTNNLDEID